jgi:hypothetical protein
MVVQTLSCLHTQPLVMVCMCVYAMHVLNFMNNQNRSKYVVFQSMDYMKQILANNPLHLQLLSLINMSMKIELQNYGIMHGQI